MATNSVWDSDLDTEHSDIEVIMAILTMTRSSTPTGAIILIITMVRVIGFLMDLPTGRTVRVIGPVTGRVIGLAVVTDVITIREMLHSHTARGPITIHSLCAWVMVSDLQTALHLQRQGMFR